MTLKEQIGKDYIEAVKSKLSIEKNILQLIRSGILQIEKDQKTTLDDVGVQNLISKMIKKIKDSIKMFEDGGRNDLVEKSNREIAVLQKYIPEAMSETELTEVIKEVIAEVNASSMKDIGKVMGLSIKKVSGRAEGGDINRIAKELLS